MATPLNIVVVEDHDSLREATVDYLLESGYRVYGFDCAEALDEHLGRVISCGKVDILIIDLNLPGEDGISLTRRLRTALPHVGVIMMTARTAQLDRINGYESGADIYLTKPTAPEELDATIRSLARRLRQDAPPAHALQLHAAKLQLQGASASISLTGSECTLLACLIQAKDRRLEYWQLIEILGNDLDSYSKAALEVQVVRLRKKLLLAGAMEPSIKALRGQGYQLCVDVILV
jgi:DNA-binding response OmpR family regulator